MEHIAGHDSFTGSPHVGDEGVLPYRSFYVETTGTRFRDERDKARVVLVIPKPKEWEI